MRLVPTRRRLFSGILTLAMIGGLLVLSAAPAWAISTSPINLSFTPTRVGESSRPIDLTVTISAGYQFDEFSYFSSPFFGMTAPGDCVGFVGPGTCVLHVQLSRRRAQTPATPWWGTRARSS